jgi:hypothetical protein
MAADPPGIITERWSPGEAVSVAVNQRIVPGVGLVTTDLASGIPHQWVRRGMATSDAPTRNLLRANEGQSSIVSIVDTLRYGKISAWLVRCKLPNPETRYDPLDQSTQVMQFEQLWQEAPLP